MAKRNKEREVGSWGKEESCQKRRRKWGRKERMRRKRKGWKVGKGDRRQYKWEWNLCERGRGTWKGCAKRKETVEGGF